MSENFQLFRLSLLLREQADLFETDSLPVRADFLRSAFSREWRFEHYGSDFHFKPDLERSLPDALLGRLGRAVKFEENLPPSQGLLETSHDGWKACVLVVDPTDHEDGQKASFQVDARVGKPVSIFAALIKTINSQMVSAPFMIHAEPIFDAETFWDFAEENEGAVTSITFEFVVPNGLWNSNTTLKEELISAREKLGAQKVINTFKSDDGLETNSEQIKEAVNYIGKGSGEIKAKAKGKKNFNSTEAPKTVNIGKDGDDGNEEPMIVRVARKIAKALGR